MGRLPDFPVEGGCICGAVRYRLTAPPLAVYACHCKDCRRSSSGPFAVGILAKADTFEVNDDPDIHRFDRRAESGNVVPQFSCAVCGTRVWHEPQRMNGEVIIRAGTLDDANWAVPAAHIWTRGEPSAAITPDAPSFSGPVPSREPLYEAWQGYLLSGER